MDQEENQLQSLGICHRLFNFIIESLATLALKPVNLGGPVCRCLAICHRLFKYIMESLASQALKPVTLGGPACHGLAQVPNPDALRRSADCMGHHSLHPVTHGTSCDDAGSRAKAEVEQSEGSENSTQMTTFSPSSHDFEKGSKGLLVVQNIGDIVSSPTPRATSQERVAKKSVSFNERTEVMGNGKKKNKKTEKLTSGKKREKGEKLQ